MILRPGKCDRRSGCSCNICVRPPPDDGWNDPEPTRIAPAPRPTVRMPRDQLAELVAATRPVHPRTVRRKKNVPEMVLDS